MKLCECGCGQPTRIATRTIKSKGYVEGEPRRFVRGHKKVTPESRARMSAAHTGLRPSLETRAKMRAVQAGRTLSAEHCANISAAKRGKPLPVRRGEKSNFWKGGITSASRAARASIEYREWRKSVLERDDWTCQDCGRRGGRLQAHHIKPFATHPELRTAIENGVTLCKACHETAHFGPTDQRKRTTAHA